MNTKVRLHNHLQTFRSRCRSRQTPVIVKYPKAALPLTDMRLVAVEFDAKTLRVIAEAEDTVRVAVTKLPER